MTPNQLQSNTSTPSLLNQNQQNQAPPLSGNDAIMSMMNTRQHSRITANLYSNHNAVAQNAALAPPSMTLVPPQPQHVNNNFSRSYNIESTAGNALNSMNNAVQNNSVMTKIPVNNVVANIVGSNTNTTAQTNSDNSLQQQIQIAGLNGITFTLPQNPAVAPTPLIANGGIDALTLSSLNGTVPEFLFQLTKMLTDEENKEVIVWNSGVSFGNHKIGGRIEVHSPRRMEEEVLGKYFRHSKYSSFQRQLNYFGFRKIAGKGKMSPCSYVNDMATSDIRSLLLIKRKGHKSADEESVASETKTSGLDSISEKVGKKRRITMPEIKSGVNLNKPISVMALGSAPSLGNSQAMQALSENAKKAEMIDAGTNNHYINVTDNGSFGLVAKKGVGNTVQMPVQNPTDVLLQAYGKITAKGVKFPMQRANLTSQTSGGTVVTSNTSFAPSSQNSASTIGTSSAFSSSCAPPSINDANFNSYLTHTSGHQALIAPAPMQFLDPNELGMSIENSLNELKNNFEAVANNVSSMTSSSQSQHSQAYDKSVGGMPQGGTAATPSPATANDFYNPRSTPNGPAKVPAHMLSRNDSLINLARDDSLVNLARIDTTADVTSYSTSLFSNLHRDDSLEELAAAMANNANGYNAAPLNDGQYGHMNENDEDAFSFIDFPHQM